MDEDEEERAVIGVGYLLRTLLLDSRSIGELTHKVEATQNTDSPEEVERKIYNFHEILIGKSGKMTMREM